MNAREELVERIAQRRRKQLAPLSDAGYQELVTDVRNNTENFIETPDEQAFLLVATALEQHEAAKNGEELLDDDAFLSSRLQRMSILKIACDKALKIDEYCLDARLLYILASDFDPDYELGPLLDLESDARKILGTATYPPDAWDDVLLRPLLRIKSVVARTCLDSARYRMAAEKCEDCIALSPSDPLGARHTCALAYARLEDESAFDALDVRFSRQDCAWEHLARTLLLYKLGRMAAARRALGGYVRLCEGGAYALLKPFMVDTYLPDRPETLPLSFPEATLAVNEADPIICDVPDFIAWAESQRNVWFSAESFAEKNDLDW